MTIPEIMWRKYVDSQIESLEVQIAELSGEYRVWLRMRENPPADLVVRGNGASAGQDSASSGPKPSKAVDTLFANVPGLTRVEAMDRLEGMVASSAGNVRAVISSTIGRRIKDGDLVVDDDRRLWPRNSEQAAAIRERERNPDLPF